MIASNKSMMMNSNQRDNSNNVSVSRKLRRMKRQLLLEYVNEDEQMSLLSRRTSPTMSMNTDSDSEYDVDNNDDDSSFTSSSSDASVMSHQSAFCSCPSNVVDNTSFDEGDNHHHHQTSFLSTIVSPTRRQQRMKRRMMLQSVSRIPADERLNQLFFTF